MRVCSDKLRFFNIVFLSLLATETNFQMETTTHKIAKIIVSNILLKRVTINKKCCKKLNAVCCVNLKEEFIKNALQNSR